MNKKQLLLDTNFFLMPGQFGIDIFSEIERLVDGGFELITLESVADELKKLAKDGSKNSGKDKQAANVGLKFLDKVKIIKSDIDNVDDAIVDFAAKNDCIVCTNDKELKKRVMELGEKVIFLRSKTHLEIA